MNTQDGIPMVMMEDIPTMKLFDKGPVSRPLFDDDIVAHQKAQLRRIMFETTREIPCVCIEPETEGR
jgi:hypothetical protein